MRPTPFLVALAYLNTLPACSDDGDDGSTAAESGGGGSGDAGGSGSSGSGGGSGDGAVDAGGSGDSGSGGGPACMGEHPEVEGDNRFCLDGFCGCGLGMMGFDVCYPEAQAEACCAEGIPLDCGGGSDGGPACMGEHPEVEGDNRFCLEGWCGCGLGMEGFDVCYPMDQAEQCCDIDALECF